MPKVPADFKGHKSYYEKRTESAQLKSEAVLKTDKAKIHNKARNARFSQKQAKHPAF